MWIDSHCHPYFEHFDSDRDAVIKRAHVAGVEKMIVVGCDNITNRKTLELCERYDFMYAVLGIHPTELQDLTDEELNFIKTNRDKIVGIGECGLDFFHNKFSADEQAEAFRKQIRLAKELDLPVVVHSRDAAEETLKILTEEDAKKVLMHCYSYDFEFGKKIWDRGYYTSFSGILTYPTAKNVREAAAKGPLELFMVETDCPFLTPQAQRGKRNEMMFVVEVGEQLAELRSEKKEKISEYTLRNTKAFFQV